MPERCQWRVWIGSVEGMGGLLGGEGAGKGAARSRSPILNEGPRRCLGPSAGYFVGSIKCSYGVPGNMTYG
jgi:hypothetical protein